MICLLIDAPDGLTHHELQFKMRIPLGSVCARMKQLRDADLTYAEGVRSGPTGEPNAVWRWRT